MTLTKLPKNILVLSPPDKRAAAYETAMDRALDSFMAAQHEAEEVYEYLMTDARLAYKAAKASAMTISMEGV